MVGEYFISQDYLYAELIELIGIELDYRSIEIEGAEPFHILRIGGLHTYVDLRAPKNLADINKIYLAFTKPLEHPFVKMILAFVKLYVWPL